MRENLSPFVSLFVATLIGQSSYLLFDRLLRKSNNWDPPSFDSEAKDTALQLRLFQRIQAFKSITTDSPRCSYSRFLWPWRIEFSFLLMMSSGPSFILSCPSPKSLVFYLDSYHRCRDSQYLFSYPSYRLSSFSLFSVLTPNTFVLKLIFSLWFSYSLSRLSSPSPPSPILTPMSFVLTLIDIVLIPFSVFWHSSPHPCSSLSYVLFLISFPFFSYHLCLFLVVYGLKQVFTSSMTMSRVRWVVTVCCSWVSVRLMPWHLTLVFLGDQMETNKTKSLPHCFDNGPLLELINHVHVW